MIFRILRNLLFKIFKASFEEELAEKIDQNSVEWVTVNTYPSKILADIDCSLLESMEIPARVSADDAGGLAPHYATASGVRLLVPEDSAQAAQEVLNKSDS
ncbi:MAG: hypothetical protein HOE90_03785 [Bacteriovoracaceae bacterium]|nr:hypothetical protein [Bacteriovoracaceae bacterium]